MTAFECGAVRRGAIMGSLLLGFCFTATACGGKEEDDGKTPVSAREVCAGAFRYASGELADLTRNKRLTDGGADYLEESAEMVDRVREGDEMHTSAHCYMRGEAASGDFEAATLYYSPGEIGRAGGPGRIKYDLGKYAAAESGSAEIFFECVVAGREESRRDPARIAVEFSHTSSGDGERVGPPDAYMRLAHSAALSVARELKCENDGGLPERLVLRRVK